MVDAIARACASAHAHPHAHPRGPSGSESSKSRVKGDDGVPSVRKEDIVRSVTVIFLPSSHISSLLIAPSSFGAGDEFSLAEARKMTSMYAKMEYGVKRLLWLGG
jgi:hypothetical protein